MPNQPTLNQNGEIALENLGDIYRELSRLYRMAENGTLDIQIANDLSNLLNLMMKAKQDQRDNKYKQRLAALWSEYQKRLKAPRVSQAALADTSVIDVTPVGEASPVRTAESSPNEEIKSAQVEMSVSNGEDK